MDRIHDILNSVNETLSEAAQKTYKGNKRSDLKDSDFLSALEAFGVDNWEGYHDAYLEVYGDEDEEDEE